MAVSLTRWRTDDPGPRCAHGTVRPRAIHWFGLDAFWGHLRHLVASAIATENIDSRQWMIPEPPDALLSRIRAVLSDRANAGETLAETMGGEVWIDFVGDTGDDVTVSEAVASLLAEDYELDGVALPRGDILFLGGDLAYPVATVLEITRRLVEPWNRVFEARADGKTRVLLAVPGNHDWYDGLDGFARLCQAPLAFEEAAPISNDPHHPRPSLNPVLAWAEAFARGDAVKKPKALALTGYVAVQRASYFRLALSPGLDLFAVDRQLKRVDSRQEAYFQVPGAPARLVIVPDPARAWGEDREHGVATVKSLGIDMGQSPTCLIAGDIHHYERSNEGPSIHIVAGGGGAFLHGARIAKGGEYAIESEFPGPSASKKLLADLPIHCATGRAGSVLVAVFAVADGVALLEHFERGFNGSMSAALAISFIVAIGTGLLVGWRRRGVARVFPFAAILGLAVGAVPVALGAYADILAERVIGSSAAARPIAFSIALALATTASCFLFGGMLALIARLGLNHAQAYAALGSGGYKHFVRIRAGKDGAIDAWVIGMVDPVRSRSAVLVDTFRFDPYAEKR